jgi:hypothetical protein
MRCLVAMLILTSSTLAETVVPTVELPSSATRLDDGFHIKIDSDVTTGTTSKGISYPAFTFDVYVPRVVGDTYLGSVFLEIVGRDNRTLAQVALEPRNPKERPPNYYVFVEQRFAANCALHFEYNARPFGNVSKDYVVRLKNHSPRTH